MTDLSKLLGGGSGSIGLEYSKEYTNKAKTPVKAGDPIKLTTDGQIVTQGFEFDETPTLNKNDKQAWQSRPEFKNLINTIYDQTTEVFNSNKQFMYMSSAFSSSRSGDTGSNMSVTATGIQISGTLVTGDTVSCNLQWPSHPIPHSYSKTFSKAVASVTQNGTYQNYGLGTFYRNGKDASGNVVSFQWRFHYVNLHVEFVDEPGVKYLHTILVAMDPGDVRGKKGEVWDTFDLPLMKTQYTSYLDFYGGYCTYKNVTDDDYQWEFNSGSIGVFNRWYSIRIDLPTTKYGHVVFDAKTMKFTFSTLPKANGSKWEKRLFNLDDEYLVETWDKTTECWWTDALARGYGVPYVDVNWNIMWNPDTNYMFVQGNIDGSKSTTSRKLITKDETYQGDWVDLNSPNINKSLSAAMFNDHIIMGAWNTDTMMVDTTTKSNLFSRLDEVGGTGNTGTTYTYDAARTRFDVSVAAGACGGAMGTFTVRVPAPSIIGTPKAADAGNAGSNFNNSIIWLGSSAAAESDNFYAFNTGGGDHRMFGILKSVDTDSSAEYPYTAVYFYVDVDTNHTTPTYTANTIRVIRGSTNVGFTYRKVYVFDADATKYVIQAYMGSAIQVSNEPADGFTGEHYTLSGHSGSYAIMGLAGNAKLFRSGASSSGAVKMYTNHDKISVRRAGGFGQSVQAHVHGNNYGGDHLAETFLYPQGNAVHGYAENSTYNPGDVNHDYGSTRHTTNCQRYSNSYSPRYHNESKHRGMQLTSLIRDSSYSGVFSSISYEYGSSSWWSGYDVYYRMHFGLSVSGIDSKGNIWMARPIGVFGTCLIFRINPTTLAVDTYYMDSPYINTGFVAYAPSNRKIMGYTYNNGYHYYYSVGADYVYMYGLMSYQFKVDGDYIMFAGSDSSNSTDYTNSANADYGKHNVLWKYPISEFENTTRVSYREFGSFWNTSKATKTYVDNYDAMLRVTNMNALPYTFGDINNLNSYIASEDIGVTSEVGYVAYDQGDVSIGDNVKVILNAAPTDLTNITDSTAAQLFEFTPGESYPFVLDPRTDSVSTGLTDVVTVAAEGTYDWHVDKGTNGYKTNYVDISVPKVPASSGRAWVELTSATRYDGTYGNFSLDSMDVYFLSDTKIRVQTNTSNSSTSSTSRYNRTRFRWRILESK